MPFRIRGVLVASDLSESATPALRAAGALASLADADLHVVHAVEGNEPDGGPRDRELEDARSGLRARLLQALPPSVRVASSHVAPGRAHEVILRRAEEVEADLLVIGPHRGRPGTGEPLGATADELVRSSAVPCLIVHAPLSLPLRRILVPSDFSKAAQGALDVALIWAAALRMPSASGEETRLDVVHALGARGSAGGDEEAEAERRLREQIGAAERQTGSAGMMQTGAAVLRGAEAVDAILHFARDRRSDLLVLGTQGQSAAEAAPMGSVSSGVARRADRPVLLVPPGFWQSWLSRNELLQEGS